MALKTQAAVLVLQDGTVYHGISFGHIGEARGEVCFNTGMTGYQEVLTDPSYSGQIVTMTYPQIGNYGVNPDDVESGRIQVAGFVVREGCDVPSNFRSTMSLPDYLDAQSIVGIQGIDTRALTRKLRSDGAMNGIICSTGRAVDELLAEARALPSMAGQDLARVVTCEAAYPWEGEGEKRFRVAALDFGIKRNILRLLDAHGCDVTVYPAQTSAEDLLATAPDGVFLSNGPGDPDAVSYGIETVRTLLGRVPLFGICLGHQLLALALGGGTYKMKFGHRGVNHPVKYLPTGKVEITSQNHGFAVDPDRLPASTEITHWNLNDNTLEGFRCTDIPAFSVQYHPEAAPGPHDSRYLFEQFIALMQK
ncbi:MAG: glutamine-hydrolyzing carbamoyl-phosphate synthase small subunit [Bacteroidetes bacterium]|nr:glutamine-hydrolyzing carbamoyl-phosphate synthase small subunit [Bacteroidota bacterium]